jgi:hypothetical protein
MARGLGVNKPCIKCGREVPFAYKSPIPGFCGRCTDEVLRTLGRAPVGAGGLGTKDAMVFGPTAGQKAGWAVVGGLIAVLVCVLFSALAPGAWDSVQNGLRGLLGLG